MPSDKDVSRLERSSTFVRELEGCVAAFAANGISARDVYLWLAARVDEHEDLASSPDRRLADEAWIRVIEVQDGYRTERSARTLLRRALETRRRAGAQAEVASA